MMDDSALKTGEGRSLHLQGASRRTSGNHVERKTRGKRQMAAAPSAATQGPYSVLMRAPAEESGAERKREWG